MEHKEKKKVRRGDLIWRFLEGSRGWFLLCMSCADYFSSAKYLMVRTIWLV